MRRRTEHHHGSTSWPEGLISMDLAEQLHILKAARDNPALLALAMVDLVHHPLPAEERARIKDALVATAMPHWCDPTFLAALLETTPEEATSLLDHLRALTVVEPFPARGAQAVNVHEGARLALRDHLRTTDAARWTALSTHAYDYTSTNTAAHARIEALYHLFAINQQAAAEACRRLDKEFKSDGHLETRHALALALTELLAAGWLTIDAEILPPLVSLVVCTEPGELAIREYVIRQLFNLGKDAYHRSWSDHAQRLVAVGHIARKQGRLDDALTAFRERLGIIERFASTDPSNVEWQYELSATHSQLGQIFESVGDTAQAQFSFHSAEEAMYRVLLLLPSEGIVNSTEIKAKIVGRPTSTLIPERTADTISTRAALSSREMTILTWITHGKTNWDIAKILGVSERTVRFHVESIFAKLDVTSRSQAIAAMINQEVTADTRKEASEAPPPLSGRELTILGLVGAGKTNWEIAQILGVSDQTVRFHLENIFTKLNVTNRAEAIKAYATRISQNLPA